MTDLGQLTCPTCGASLEASSNMGTIKCSYCGNEFSVRQAAGSMYLETFARCPLCGRNDKVEKVSGIVSRATQDISGATIATSLLAKQLNPPAPPTSPPGPESPLYKAVFRPYDRAIGWGIVVLLVSIPFVCDWLIALIKSGNPSLLIGFFIWGSIFAGAILLIRRGNRKEKELRKGFEILKAQWQASMGRWKKSIGRWNRLYYCSRDDVIFIPGEKQAVPPGRMSEIL